MADKKPAIYREFIDCIVEVCNKGQGQISSRKILSGVWNQNANDEKLRANSVSLQEQYKLNLLLQRLSQDDRELLAGIMEEAFRGGVFETLYYLEDYNIEPFVGGYEGSPHEDFIGRVDKENTWNWPEEFGSKS